MKNEFAKKQEQEVKRNESSAYKVVPTPRKPLKPGTWRGHRYGSIL